nr:MAG TPA: Protein of unknown function (DUF1133) [Caudoviricetes sp.]
MTDDELEGYLVNWGRWCREGQGRSSSSIATVTKVFSESTDDGASCVIASAAEKVNRIWQGMPNTFYEERCIKALMGGYYANTGSIGSLLGYIRRVQKLRIREHDVDRFVEKGKEYICRRLEAVV